MDTWKLQKLTFYIQSWSLAENDAPAFDDEIQAFPDGPVARDLFSATQNMRDVTGIPTGNASLVSDAVRSIEKMVWNHFGQENGRTLRELTHAEYAWMEAREGLAENEPSQRPLSHETMASSARRYLDAMKTMPDPIPDESIEDYLARVTAASR